MLWSFRAQLERSDYAFVLAAVHGEFLIRRLFAASEFCRGNPEGSLLFSEQFVGFCLRECSFRHRSDEAPVRKRYRKLLFGSFESNQFPGTFIRIGGLLLCSLCRCWKSR